MGDTMGDTILAILIALFIVGVVTSAVTHTFVFDCEDEYNKRTASCEKFRSSAENYENCILLAQERMAECQSNSD